MSGSDNRRWKDPLRFFMKASGETLSLGSRRHNNSNSQSESLPPAVVTAPVDTKPKGSLEQSWINFHAPSINEYSISFSVQPAEKPQKQIPLESELGLNMENCFMSVYFLKQLVQVNIIFEFKNRSVH
jgi:hypothetical protein